MEKKIETVRTPAPRAMWSTQMQCGWISWSVVDDGILRLDMPEGQCCSMAGAIAAAEALCPAVHRIETYAEGVPDTMYWHQPSGWEVVVPRFAKMLYAA